MRPSTAPRKVRTSLPSFTRAITQTNRADGNAVEALQQERVVIGVGSLWAGIARRMHAGRAAQRVDLEPGIVGEQIAVGEAAVVFRLADGVLFERGAGLIRRRHGAGKLLHIEIGSGQLKLSQLPRIRRRAVNDHLSSNCLWIATSSPIPCRASASKSASCASSNGVFSAVACTSTNFPAPVITTFISTSACESS